MRPSKEQLRPVSCNYMTINVKVHTNCAQKHYIKCRLTPFVTHVLNCYVNVSSREISTQNKH